MPDFNLRRFMERAEWMDDAQCRGVDPAKFVFPEDTRTPKGAAKLAEAREICHRCDVQSECLAFALNITVEGIWAGTTESQRRKIKRHRNSNAANEQAAAARPVAPPVARGCGTEQGYFEHRRNGSDQCDPCKAAHSAAEARREAERVTRAWLAEQLAAVS